MIESLAKHANTKRRLTSTLYQSPGAPYLASYLIRLEQLVAIRCAAMEDALPSFLHGEREIVEGNLQLCLGCSDNVATRLLLVQTLLTMNKIKPEVVHEFSDLVLMLHKENPLREPAQRVVQEMLNELIPS